MKTIYKKKWWFWWSFSSIWSVAYMLQSWNWYKTDKNEIKTRSRKDNTKHTNKKIIKLWDYMKVNYTKQELYKMYLLYNDVYFNTKYFDNPINKTWNKKEIQNKINKLELFILDF